MNESKSDFDKMCRLCTKTVASLSSIFDDDNDGISASIKLRELCGVQISTNDDYPKHVCKSCRRKLKSSYEFRNACLSSELYLQTYLQEQEADKEDEADLRYFIEVEDENNDYEADLDLADVENIWHIANSSANVTNHTITQQCNTLSEAVNSDINKSDENNAVATEKPKRKYRKTKTRKVTVKTKKRNDTENYDPNKRHKCKVCKKRFGSQLRVKLHMQRIHKQIYLAECNVVCPKCGMKFQHMRNLKRHLVYHNMDSYFGCNFCDKKLYSKKAWRKHIKIHDTEINEICKICNKTLLSKVSHLYHMDYHRTKDVITNKTIYSCYTCNIDFKLFENLEKHSFKMHCLRIPDEHNYLEGLNQNGDEFNSSEIDSNKNKENITTNEITNTRLEQFKEVERNFEKIFSDFNKDELNLNAENSSDVDNDLTNVTVPNGEQLQNGDSIQNGVKNNFKLGSINASVTFRCNICARFYKNLPDLKFHVEDCYKKVDRPKSFMCDICGKCFASAWTLTNHKAGHSNVRPYVCDTCGQCFKWHNDLTNHKKRIHEKFRPYVCKICGKRCGTSATLKSHMRLHTGERPYVCSYCNASFTQNCSLKEHMFKHTGGEEGICPICNKVFKTPLRLRTHMKRHNTQRKLFPCDLCGRLLTEKSSVRKHKFKVHNDVSS